MALKDFLPDTESDTALEALHRAEKVMKDCDAKATRLLQDIAALEVLIGRATDDNRARELATKLRSLEDERTINAARRKVAAEDLERARVEQRKAGNAVTAKSARRNTKALVDNTEEMVRHLEAATRCFVRHYELGQKIKLSIPIESNDAMLLEGSQFIKRLMIELWRMVPVHPVGVRTAHPPFPGSMFPQGDADPATMETLVDAVKEAAAYIVRCVEEGGQKYTSVPLPTAPIEQQPISAAEVEPAHHRMTV